MASDENNLPQHPHFLIPEGEVHHYEKPLTARDRPRDVHHSEHGELLLNSVKEIETRQREKKSSLGDTMIFKMQLSEDQKLGNRARREFLEKNKIHIKVVRDQRTAIVSMEESDLVNLKTRIDDYRRFNRRDDFQYLDPFLPITAADKQSLSLRQKLSSSDAGDEVLDIQIQLLPNLGEMTYEYAVRHLTNLVAEEGGSIAEDPFYLSNHTPVLRYFMPSSAVSIVTNDDAVYRIELTPSYEFSVPPADEYNGGMIQLDPDIDVNKLPVVGVIDTGVNFPGVLASLLAGEWISPGLKGLNKYHGTMVASRVVFGATIKDQVDTGLLTPRARVHSILISDSDRMNGTALLKNIQQAVAELADTVKIFNISINEGVPIEDTTISIFANVLDSLTATHGVAFVVSAGNQRVWLSVPDLGDVFEEAATRIAAPADSYLGITVGAAVLVRTPDGGVSTEIAPYTRRGPGFAKNSKVDIMGEGGGADLGYHGNGVAGDAPAYGIDHVGLIQASFGTSFAAPIVAGDLAQIYHNLPDQSLLIARTLMLHTAAPVHTDEDQDPEARAWIQRITGHGLSDPDRALMSTNSSVTFLAQGHLNRTTKAHVTFGLPSVLLDRSVLPGTSQRRQPLVRVRVTCVCLPPFDQAKGQEYLGAYVSASLHGLNTKGNPNTFNPPASEGRTKWQPVQHFSRLLTAFGPGDWEVWLEMMGRWETANDDLIPYAIAITIEDPTDTLDVYSAVQAEFQGRFIPMNRPRLRP